jgi:hypothetical protein
MVLVFTCWLLLQKFWKLSLHCICVWWGGMRYLHYLILWHHVHLPKMITIPIFSLAKLKYIGDNFPVYGIVYYCTWSSRKKTLWSLCLVVVTADTKWQLGKNDVKARLAHLRTSGDFSDCVLVVGSGENVEVCILSFFIIMYCAYLRLLLVSGKKMAVLCNLGVCIPNCVESHPRKIQS